MTPASQGPRWRPRPCPRAAGSSRTPSLRPRHDPRNAITVYTLASDHTRRSPRRALVVRHDANATRWTSLPGAAIWSSGPAIIYIYNYTTFMWYTVPAQTHPSHPVVMGVVYTVDVRYRFDSSVGDDGLRGVGASPGQVSSSPARPAVKV